MADGPTWLPIAVAPFTWDDWPALWAVRRNQLAEHGIRIDPATLPKRPQPDADIDLLWPTLLLLGVETVRISPGITRVTPLDFSHYPISHSLLAVTVWAFLFGAACYLTGRFIRGAVVSALLVLSHWLLDALTHRPDLPLAPGSGIRVGLGLWNSLPATVAVEILIFGIGVMRYARATRASDRVGSVGFWALVAFLLTIYFGNIFGPPPPSVEAIAWTSQAQWLLVGWAYWLDRHREFRLP